MEVGKVKRVAGPLVQAVGLKASMYDLVLVGEEGLMSEVIGISGNKHVIQVYEDTGGVRPGEPVKFLIFVLQLKVVLLPLSKLRVHV